jgi:hypothetical protein
MTMTTLPLARTVSTLPARFHHAVPRPTGRGALLLFALSGTCLLAAVNAAWPTAAVVLAGLVRQLLVMSRSNASQRP